MTTATTTITPTRVWGRIRETTATPTRDTTMRILPTIEIPTRTPLIREPEPSETPPEIAVPARLARGAACAEIELLAGPRRPWHREALSLSASIRRDLEGSSYRGQAARTQWDLMCGAQVLALARRPSNRPGNNQDIKPLLLLATNLNVAPGQEEAFAHETGLAGFGSQNAQYTIVHLSRESSLEFDTLFLCLILI